MKQDFGMDDLNNGDDPTLYVGKSLINTVALARWLESEEFAENRFNGFR